MINFNNYQNRVETEASPTGEPIYKWDYVDLKGEIQQDERDVYAQIQSGFRITDYKAQIAQGVLDSGNNNDNLYLDTTQLGSSYDDIDNYLNDLLSRVTALKKSNPKNPPLDDKSGKTIDESGASANDVSGAQKSKGEQN